MAKKGSNQAERERETKKKKTNRGKQEHSWRLSGPSPSSLLRGGERQNKRHEKSTSQGSANARVARSKAGSAAMPQGGPPPGSPPPAVGGARGSCGTRCPCMAGPGGPWRGACPTKGKRLPLRVRRENTHSESGDELAEDA